MFSTRYVIFAALVVMALLMFWQCDTGTPKPTEIAQSYWGHSDSVEYVGIMKCASCHGDIYKTFVETGMGKSFGPADPQKSAADLSHHPQLFDKKLNFYYQPFWHEEALFLREYRLENGDTVHNLVIKADYVVGSGQHTNSHLFSHNDYQMQMPFTWYAQEGKLDFPPGYEDGNNSRFERTIGLECMSCHNAMPVGFVAGSENKFTNLAAGIDCERCHGPGGAHVRKITAGLITDTAKEVDYSIINPKKLTTQLQFELCSRCHLQGNAVLAPGKSFFDFKPGMPLNEVMDVYLPRYTDDKENFIMASHVDRFKMSDCFKAGDGKFVCTSCHNPHVSVTVTGKAIFDETCKSCHGGANQKACSAPMEDRLATDDYCNGCHMPKSGSIDIPHVTVHDHYIRKPKKEAEKIAQVRQFLGLTAVNNAQPSERSKIRAFLQQYEKFGGEPFLLDSAAQLLRRQSTTLFFNEKVQLWHLKGDFSQVLKTVGEIGEAIVLRDHLTKKSYDNEHAWTAYRIGEAYLQKGQQEIAEKFVSQAIVLAPYILSFQNKLGAIHVRASRWEAAKMQYEKILLENDYHTEAHANLGYVNLRLGHWSLAEQHLTKALQQRPDYELALLNLGLLYLQQDKLEASRRVTKRLLRINPTHSEGIHLLSIINQNL